MSDPKISKYLNPPVAFAQLTLILIGVGLLQFYPSIGPGTDSIRPTDLQIQLIDWTTPMLKGTTLYIFSGGTHSTHPHLWKLSLVGVKGDDHLVRELVSQIRPKHLVVLSLQHFTSDFHILGFNLMFGLWRT